MILIIMYVLLNYLKLISSLMFHPINKYIDDIIAIYRKCNT